MNKAMDWLAKNIPEQTKTSVVHGDFRVDNLIYDENDPSKVLAVLDWELSTLGDPLSDTAYGCMAHYMPHQVEMLKGLKGLDLKSLGIPTDHEYMIEYCKNTCYWITITIKQNNIKIKTSHFLFLTLVSYPNLN